MAERLSVLINARRAGEIVRRGGRLTFRYDSSYTATPGATPLSLSMPLVVEEHPHAVIEPFLWGLLPDNDEVLRRWGREFGVSARNCFALLTHVGEDCAGAVQFAPPERETAISHGDVEWLDEQVVEERIRLLRQDPTAWQLTGSQGQFSLAGAQAKTALYFDGTRWGKPSGRIPTTHILKPAIVGLDDHDLNEHLCLQLARRLNLTAARSRVQTFGSERVIVVERYDRRRSDAGWSRVHQEDLCQSLGVHRDRKYQSQGGPSPEQIIRLLRSSMPSPAANPAVFAFLEALGLNWILAGTDAHAKNYSVLLSGAAVRLAPLYDVASALPYPEMDPHRLTLAMKIGGEYSLSYIGRSNWLRLATSSGVDPDELIDRLSQLSAGAADELSVVCDSEEIRELNSALPGRLLDAVAVRAAECRSRLEGAARGVDGDAARRADDWTAGLATLLIDNLASPQVQTVLAVVDRNGRATPEDLREVLGGSRRNLRGLLGPITKAMSRLQARRLLPMGLAKPLTSHYALDAQGQSRLVWLAMPEAHLSAFREALRSQHLSIAAGGADDAAD